MGASKNPWGDGDPCVPNSSKKAIENEPCIVIVDLAIKSDDFPWLS